MMFTMATPPFFAIFIIADAATLSFLPLDIDDTFACLRYAPLFLIARFRLPILRRRLLPR